MPIHSKKKRIARIQGGLGVKTDCFAYKTSTKKCNACNDLYCLTEQCPYYKTEFERCTECKATRTSITCAECITKGLK